jgi:hypothetical protein
LKQKTQQLLNNPFCPWLSEALVRAACDALPSRIALSADIDHEVALSGVGDTPAVMDVLTSLDFEILCASNVI